MDYSATVPTPLSCFFTFLPILNWLHNFTFKDIKAENNLAKALLFRLVCERLRFR